jgi:hypothetical protein
MAGPGVLDPAEDTATVAKGSSGEFVVGHRGSVTAVRKAIVYRAKQHLAIGHREIENLEIVGSESGRIFSF